MRLRVPHQSYGPAGAEAPVQYGPRIAAVIVYLYAGQFLSKDRTAQALAELFGIPLSSGTVAAPTARAAGRLDEFARHVREQIAASGVAGSDETGFQHREFRLCRLPREPGALDQVQHLRWRQLGNPL